ncbi:Response regulator receiver domain containing protein [Trichomonas vaginalis G3]|uniref:Phosphodiesterase n=1 Tax=Trichomonas vaginalis (strain ATCC PRA-98 / G3) TaxID=412133 RepID=A2E4B2_TRIV3|nr:3',5'-cyclic-nucleotide phosphodiesterase protein [Trichomonas vaginalis G3]EAY12558.1 Response regulator receiver domain containing protein [Trichomonas vaginalis G3]KAI5554100.1 3',5'-cyclic-nucleotide phosphodiesterase protein [Trichomonas vaginalis G3]|eukprot:XP_001324781.1 Response regulator receiver domain containing protein [Trichomonas vaginalis G3]
MSGNLPFRRDDLHILAVDDDAVQLHAVTKALKSLGYHVSNASNGQEALEVLKSGNTFDLILSDVMMPVMNGPQFLQETRADSRFEQIPIIMMSSNDQYEIVFDCLSKGADDYIIKPLTPQVLKNMYANVWLKRKQNAAAAKVQHQNIEKEVIQRRINEMKQSFNQSVKTPINDITKSLEAILQSSGMSPDALSTLTAAINKLKTIDSEGEVIPQPVPAVSPDMKDYLQSNFGVGAPKKPITPIAVKAAIKVRAPPPTVPVLTPLNLGDKLLDLQFNIWDIAEIKLMNLANDLFTHYGLKEIIKAKDGEIEHFLQKTQQSFNLNPFHNFRRSIAGLQFATMILSKYKERVPPFEAAAGLFAALLHDIGHPGTNNMFQIRTSSQLALIYNDKSVLEMNSASVGARLVQEVFSFSIDDQDFSTLRATFLSNVLATDYSKLQKFLAKAANIKMDWENKEHRQIALQLLTLMSDLSFAIRNWKTTSYWYGMMRDEHYIQGDMERKRNMKSIPLMDRRANRPNTELIKTHFEIMVMPVFQLGAKIFPEFEQLLLLQLQVNHDIILEMEKVEQTQPQSAQQDEIPMTPPTTNPQVINQVQHQQQQQIRAVPVQKAAPVRAVPIRAVKPIAVAPPQPQQPQQPPQ